MNKKIILTGVLILIVLFLIYNTNILIKDKFQDTICPTN